MRLPPESATEHTKVLVHVLDELKKAADPARQPEVQTVRLRAVTETKAAQAAGDAAEIAKLNKERRQDQGDAGNAR